MRRHPASAAPTEQTTKRRHTHEGRPFRMVEEAEGDAGRHGKEERGTLQWTETKWGVQKGRSHHLYPSQSPVPTGNSSSFASFLMNTRNTNEKRGVRALAKATSHDQESRQMDLICI